MSEELTSLHKERYGAWAGNPNGIKPDPSKCAEPVYRGSISHGGQCTRKRGHGPEGAYCKQHDPAAVKARAEANNKAWREKFEQSPLGQLKKASATIQSQQEEIDRLREALAGIIDDWEYCKENGISGREQSYAETAAEALSTQTEKEQ